MPVVSASDKQLLLTYLLRSERVLQQAYGRLSLEHFSEMERPLALLWSVASKFYEQHRKCIPRVHLEAEVNNRLSQDSTWNQYELESLVLLIDRAYGCPESDLVPDAAIQSILQPLLYEPVYATMAAMTDGFDGEADLPTQVKQVSDKLAAATVTSAETLNLSDVDDPRMTEVRTAPTATGCEVFDILTGGGVRPQLLVLIMAPTGGGKTLLSLHAAVSAARRGLRALVCQYEFPVVPILRDRIWCCASGVPFNEIDGIDRKMMAPGNWKRIAEAVGHLGGRCEAANLHEHGKGSGGAEEVASLVRDYESRCGHVDLVVVDWLGYMAEKYMGARDIGPEMKRQTMDRILNGLRDQVAIRFNTCVVLAQQVNATAGSKSLDKPAGLYDGADHRMLAALADFSISVGRLDRNHRCKVINVKARGEMSEVLVHMDNRLMRATVIGRGETWRPVVTPEGEEWAKDDK